MPLAYQHIHSSPPQVTGELPVPTTLESSVKVIWAETDEAEFIQYNADCKQEADEV